MRDHSELAHFAKTIELDQVRARIAARAASEPGRLLARELAPLEERSLVEAALARTREAALLAEPPDLSGVASVAEIFDRARVAKRALDPRELWLLAMTVRAGEAARQAPLGPALRALTVPVDPSYAERVAAVIDPETFEVRFELVKDIREARLAARSELAERLTEIALEHPGASVTERRGRLCLATRSALAGTLLDREGAVTFLEPESARELANRVLELELEEAARTDRLLVELDALARAHEPAIRALGALLARLDLHLALGRWARELDLREPVLGDALVLEQVRHPLLAESALRQAQGERCVPIDVRLEETRLLVITGPNGGGKTVALKTTGLAVLLALSGSFVPARSARVPLAGELLAASVAADDLAHGLSTFEVHARRLAAVAQRAEPSSLVLLDELGLGTDPIEGGALARALLEHLLARGARVLATTHLGPLKVFAATTPGAAVASVEVDARGRPLYRLAVGKAGESSALAVARRAGVPEPIVTRAEAILHGR